MKESVGGSGECSSSFFTLFFPFLLQHYSTTHKKMTDPPNDNEAPLLRPDRIDLYTGLNKVTLVPGTAAPGKRGKGVGFYCEACNLTYRDSIQYLDHLNSKQHQYQTGVKDSNVPIATLEDVKKRLKFLVEQRNEKLKEQALGGGEFDIQKRIEKRKQMEEEERVKRQQARAEKRKRQKKRKREENDDASGEQDEQDEGNKRQAMDMAKMMGFSNFGTSSKA